MLTRYSRQVLTSVALALTAAGCGAGGDDTDADITDPDLPLGVTMAVTGSAFTVQVGTSTAIPVTITRQGGYLGTVDVTVAGLPSGVRAEVPRFFGATMTGNVIITATANAVPSAAATFNVTGQAQAITITPRPITLSVTR